jgi:hypothetical protein
MPVARVITRQNARPSVGKGQSGPPKRRSPSSHCDGAAAREVEALTWKAIELALAGDSIALWLCLERIFPPQRQRPIMSKLPSLRGAGDAAVAIATIEARIVAGDITPVEAANMAKPIEALLCIGGSRIRFCGSGPSRRGADEERS